MLVGVPKEIKPQEYRVGLVPSSVHEITQAGGTVWVEQDLGANIGIPDAVYKKAGAKIVKTADEIYENATLIVKVKEPQPTECRKLREGQTLFTFLHLAADPLQTRLLTESGVTAIAYETVTQAGGGLPLLAPMSQVAGRLAVQAGAHTMEMAQGGCGLLLGGVPGVAPAKVVILGGGVVGLHAITMALGLGADVVVLDTSLNRLQVLASQFGPQLKTIFASKAMIEHYVVKADLVIGAVLVPGAAAPRLVSRALLAQMHPQSVVVDVAIDQGGCFETSRPTTHEVPTYVEEGVIHYCVTNMPAAVPRTSAFALNNATLPFVMSMVTKGVKLALLDNPHLLAGLNIHKGQVTCEAVAKELGYAYVPPLEALH